jgi:anti-sigma B factor antagonist
MRELSVSNTGWTPAVPGHTNDMRRPASQDDPGHNVAMTGGEDVVAEQVIDLDVKRDGGTVVVRVGGEVDMLTTPLLGSCLAEQLETEPGMLVVDMSNVGFLGSSGLAALVTARDEAAGRQVTLRLVSADHAVLRPLTATGLAELFDIYPDLETALDG